MNKKTVIVTGASKGIGCATSLKLLEEGYRVIGLSRSFKDSPIQHPNFISQSIDLSAVDILPSYLKELIKQFPETEGLICNAGQWHFGNLEEMSFEKIRYIMDLNFLSHAYLVKAFLPLFKKRKRGDIIFIGSESAHKGHRKQAIYSASKFALKGFAETIRSECATKNIRISIIHPTLVKSNFFNQMPFSPGEDPTHHILPSDIAKLIHFMLEARAGAVFDEINLSPQKHHLDFAPLDERNANSKDDASELILK